MDRPVLVLKRLNNRNVILGIEWPTGEPRSLIELDNDMAFKLLVELANPHPNAGFVRLPANRYRATWQSGHQEPRD